MTVVNPDSIAGITSVTSSGTTLEFYDVNGNLLDVSANLTGELTVGTGATISSPGASIIDFETNGSERLRIGSSGQIGIAGANYGSSGQVLTSAGSGSAVTWSAIPSQVTIANNADNRVITGGSGTNLNGESNLTFDGAKLTVTSSSKDLLYLNSTHSDGPQIPIQTGGTTFSYIGSAASLFSTGSSTDLGIRAESSKHILFGIGGNEKVRINSTGQLLLGAGAVATTKVTQAGSLDLDSGGISLCIGGNENSSGRTNSANKLNRVVTPHYTNAEEPMAMISGYSTSGASELFYGGGSGLTNAVTTHHFYTAANPTTTSGTERIRVVSNGQIIVGEANTSPANDFEVRRANAGGDVSIRIGNNTSQNSGSTASLYFTTSPTQDFNTFYIQAHRSDGSARFGYGSSENMRLSNDGLLGLNVTPSYSGLFGGTQKGIHIGGTTAPFLRITSSTSSQGDLILQAGNSGGDVQMGNLNGGGDIVFWNKPSGGSLTERVRFKAEGNTYFAGQKHEFRYDNAGGQGAYLSIQNRHSSSGTAVGISFGCDNSDASMTTTDYGNGQIKVTNDGSGGGIMEFNVHHGSSNFSAIKIHGNAINQSSTNSVTNAFKGGVAFGCAGVAIDKSWDNYPGLHVFNTTGHGDTNQGQFRFHGWNRSYASYVNSSGSDFGVTVVADGMTITSDERRKTGISTITNALDTVSKLRGVSFTMVNRDLTPQTHMSMDGGKKLGFIAQEVIPILPAAVMDSGDHVQPLENGYCDRYMMDYGVITPVLVEAIKELTKRIESIEAQQANDAAYEAKIDKIIDYFKL